MCSWFIHLNWNNFVNLVTREMFKKTYILFLSTFVLSCQFNPVNWFKSPRKWKGNIWVKFFFEVFVICVSIRRIVLAALHCFPSQLSQILTKNKKMKDENAIWDRSIMYLKLRVHLHNALPTLSRFLIKMKYFSK